MTREELKAIALSGEVENQMRLATHPFVPFNAVHSAAATYMLLTNSRDQAHELITGADQFEALELAISAAECTLDAAVEVAITLIEAIADEPCNCATCQMRAKREAARNN